MAIKHIGFLTSEYPHEKVNHAAGIGTSIKNLAQALTAEGVRVSVFVYGQQQDEIFTEQLITIHTIKARQYGLVSWFRYRKFIAEYLNRSIKSDNIDIIEAPDWTGITAFMKLDAQLVIRLHGSDAYFCHLEHRKQKKSNFFFEKMGILNGDAFVSPSEYAAKISKFIFRIKKEVVIIPNGISLSQFSNKSPEKFEKGTILYVGTLIRKKGVLELPGIFKEVKKAFPDAKLVIIGNDAPDLATGSPSTWKLAEQQFDDDIKTSVSYLGKVPYEEVRNYIRKANVCVFPTFAETQGMVTIESMAMSKAIVNSNIGWSEELIEDGINGFLVHPSDHSKFAGRIISILEDEQLCLKLGIAAREKAESHFDISKIGLANIDFYNSLLSK